MNAERQARAVIEGRSTIPIADVEQLASDLRSAGQIAVVSEMLTSVARRALDGQWTPDERVELAKVLRDHQQFSHARRLLARARRDGPDREEFRQQHALCTYKDLELLARRRLDRALEILESVDPLENSTDSETLGIAGAIYKRRWEVDAKRVDLENALWAYQRGFEQNGHPERWYCGINAAFVADRLAALETASRGGATLAAQFRQQADNLRLYITENLQAGGKWDNATRGEAFFGLGEFEQAQELLADVAARTPDIWRQETTATQLANLADMRGFLADPKAQNVLATLVRGNVAAVRRASVGKIGLALSGGGYRASLFHIGVLARLAECNVLRSVEVLSCVSGGSILGAHYYLKLRALLQRTPDQDISDRAYVDLVYELSNEFLGGVRRNLRGHLLLDVPDNMRMLLTKYSLSDRAGELLEEHFYAPLREADGPWLMTDLPIQPAGTPEGFTPMYENWTRAAKVPMLVLNATTLNTGHSWQFTATRMGEPPSTLDDQLDASQRLRRLEYASAPEIAGLRHPTLGKAVAASACVPGLFPPVTLTKLYPGIDVELVDGGVHDNQGIASLLEQDCSVVLVSDASGQLRDTEEPKRRPLGVLFRSNSVLMKRVRGAQYEDLLGRVRVGALRGFMTVHLTKGLRARPRDWVGCKDPAETDGRDRPDVAASPYQINSSVQLALSELRTDLDSFTDDEAYALMAAGYLMTEHDLAEALPAMATAEPALELGTKWPFWAVLKTMDGPKAAKLAKRLDGGDIRFWRKTRTWLSNTREKIPFLRKKR